MLPVKKAGLAKLFLSLDGIRGRTFFKNKLKTIIFFFFYHIKKCSRIFNAIGRAVSILSVTI